MTTTNLLKALVDFSYSQFHVFDFDVPLPGCKWTDGHSAQGFARRPGAVNFATLLEFGTADVAAYVGDYPGDRGYQRAIEVPLSVRSGKVAISGPEEFPLPEGRLVSLAPGEYRLIAAQTIVAEDRESIDLYFERLSMPLTRSRIVLADDALRAADVLIESAEVA